MLINGLVAKRAFRFVPLMLLLAVGSVSCGSGGGGDGGGSATSSIISSGGNGSSSSSGGNGSSSSSSSGGNGSSSSSSSGSSSIVPSLVAARTTGVAPLAVFFDATGTTDPATTNAPFHDLLYSWSFGDSGAANWTYGARPGVLSKNAAYGPLAAHVFETPGTYTVTLTVFNGTTTAQRTQTITVADPNTVFAGTATYCFSNSTDFTGCPSGATRITTSSFSTAIASYQGTGRRLLFKRGNTFTSNAAGNIVATGPGIVGAFGTGSKPLILAASTNIVLQFSRNDWRAMDLEINGQNNRVYAFASNNANQSTVLRVDAHNVHNAFTSADFTANDQYFVHDCGVTNIMGGTPTSAGHVIWVFASRYSLQGNSFDSAKGGEQVTRFPRLTKAVISNNYMANAADTKEIVKLHQANPYSNQAVWDGYYTEQVILADNWFQGSSGIPWTITAMAQNNNYPEHLRNILIERNYLPSSGGTQIHIWVSADNSTVRNNIVNLTGAAYHYGIMVAKYGTQAVPNNVKVYNNTIYSADAGNFFGVVDHDFSGNGSVNVSVINNLGVAPNASGPVVVSLSGGNNTQSNNLFSASPASIFTSATPNSPAGFALKALPNPVRDAGLGSVLVWQDFFNQPRSSGSMDIGAAGH